MVRLLVIGGNPPTAGLVQTAESMGIETVVIDADPKAYAKRYAWKSFDVDGTDAGKVAEIARSEGVDGAVLGAVEILMGTYSAVCAELGVPCYAGREALELFSDKESFKSLCRECGVPAVDGCVFGPDDLERLPRTGFPLIVKPADSSGSRGISVCHGQDSLPEAFSVALAHSPSGRALIETYMTGQETVVYYALQDGEPVLLGLCDRYTARSTGSSAQLPTAYIFPSRFTEEYVRSEDAAVKAMLRKAGAENGVMFLQGFAGEDGTVSFYESGYRLSGAQEHYIFAETCGIDSKRMMIDYALGGRMADYRVADRADPMLGGRWGCKLSVLAGTGKISRIRGIDEIRRLEGVISVNPSYDEGDEITGAGTLKQIVCRFFAVADTPEKLGQTIDQIYSLYDVYGEDGKSMLTGRFDTGLLAGCRRQGR